MEKWRKTPIFNQIEAVSKASHIPLGYFFLKNLPIEEYPLIEYRTIGSVAVTELSRDIIDALNHMERIQDWLIDFKYDEVMPKTSNSNDFVI